MFSREKSFAFFFLHSYIVVFVRGDLVNESCNVKMFSAIVLGHMFVLIEKKNKEKRGKKETIMKKTSTSKLRFSRCFQI